MATALTLGVDGPGWWIFVPVFWIAAWLVVVSFFWRRRRGWCARQSRVSGETVLGKRYARGEITDAEYRERLSVLRESSG